MTCYWVMYEHSYPPKSTRCFRRSVRYKLSHIANRKLPGIATRSQDSKNKCNKETIVKHSNNAEVSRLRLTLIESPSDSARSSRSAITNYFLTRSIFGRRIYHSQQSVSLSPPPNNPTVFRSDLRRPRKCWDDSFHRQPLFQQNQT